MGDWDYNHDDDHHLHHDHNHHHVRYCQNMILLYILRYCQNMEDARLALAGMGENCELLLSCQVSYQDNHLYHHNRQNNHHYHHHCHHCHHHLNTHDNSHHHQCHHKKMINTILMMMMRRISRMMMMTPNPSSQLKVTSCCKCWQWRCQILSPVCGVCLSWLTQSSLSKSPLKLNWWCKWW